MNVLIKSMFMLTMASALGGSMVSCSENDTEEISPSQRDAISFGAVVPNQSRAESVTSTSINNFMVYAYTDGKPYMDGVKVTKSGTKWGYSPVVYWPSTPVNFYAYSPDITNAPSLGVTDSDPGTIANFTTSGTTDLIYAVNLNEIAKSSPVLLNFRHALSRVDINLSSTNSAIIVKVAHVSLEKIFLTGTFSFPKASTSDSQPGNVGSWSDLKKNSDLLTYYAMTEEEFATLTSTPTNLAEGNLEVCFMVPQPLSPLVSESNGYSGNAIQVDCEIFDAKSGAKIWPTANTPAYQLVPETGCGKLMFPVTTPSVTEWKIGHAYVYNIVIDNPAVLHPISFSVSVDEFTLDSTE